MRSCSYVRFWLPKILILCLKHEIKFRLCLSEGDAKINTLVNVITEGKLFGQIYDNFFLSDIVNQTRFCHLKVCTKVTKLSRKFGTLRKLPSCTDTPRQHILRLNDLRLKDVSYVVRSSGRRQAIVLFFGFVFWHLRFSAILEYHVWFKPISVVWRLAPPNGGDFFLALAVFPSRNFSSCD